MIAEHAITVPADCMTEYIDIQHINKSTHDNIDFIKTNTE